MIAERQHAVADDLPALMALAGDQQRIARLEIVDRGADRRGAVADLPGALRFGKDRRANGFRLLAARIVIGDDDTVGILRRDRARESAARVWERMG